MAETTTNAEQKLPGWFSSSCDRLWRAQRGFWTLFGVGVFASLMAFLLTLQWPFTSNKSLDGTFLAWCFQNSWLLLFIGLFYLACFGVVYIGHRYHRLALSMPATTTITTPERLREEPQHEESPVILAKGGQRTLDELPLKTVTPPSTPSSVEATNQEIPPHSQNIWNVPYRRNPFFTGRERLLEQLHNNLTAGQATALTQAQAINGLGGIGKTQVAIEYAYRHRQSDLYHFIFWVNADTRERLIADYVEIARLLHLPEQHKQDQNIIVAAVKRWLAMHHDCLLILDNADDLTMIENFLPIEMTCHTLITTREQHIGPLAQSIEVEKMAREEGTLLLLRRAKILLPDAPLEQASREERAAAEQIVQEMGGLPLALDQAGAYIEEKQSTPTRYLQTYQSKQAHLLRERGKYGNAHPDPVTITWSINFEQVEQKQPMAADLLRCCAFLAPDDIPEELFTEGANDLSPSLQPLATDASLLDEAIAELLRFSLVRRNRDTTTLSIHRLVQAILRLNMDEATQRLWSERAVRIVNNVFPRSIDVNKWKQCQRYVAHAQTCATFIAAYDLAFPEAALLLNQTAYYLNDLALYPEAEPLFELALHIREQALGPQHPATAVSLNNLAELYYSQGKFEQAEPLYQRALHIREQVSGTEHPDTAQSLNNLAELYRSQGKFEQAEPLYLRALRIDEQVSGPQHPDTAVSFNNLASLYKNQGKYEQAEPLYQHALQIMEKTLGANHPTTVIVRKNYALFLEAKRRKDQG